MVLQVGIVPHQNCVKLKQPSLVLPQAFVTNESKPHPIIYFLEMESPAGNAGRCFSSVSCCHSLHWRFPSTRRNCSCHYYFDWSMGCPLGLVMVSFPIAPADDTPKLLAHVCSFEASDDLVSWSTFANVFTLTLHKRKWNDRRQVCLAHCR